MRKWHKEITFPKAGLVLTLMGLAMMALLGCSHTASEAEKAAGSDWQMPEDPEAAAYFSSCKDEFHLASQTFAALESHPGYSQPQELLQAINELDIQLDGPLSRTSLLSNVHPNAALREAAQNCQQRFVALLGDISLSRPLYNHLARLDLESLDALDRRFVEKMLRDFRRSGVDKEDATRARIKQLIEEINKIGQTFGKNILEDKREITVASAERLAGLPEDYLTSRTRNEKGEWVISTDYPDYMPIIQYARDDSLREEMYRVFRQRAYPANKPILMDLLAKRHELAQLLGYRNWAEYVTEDKMIKSPDNAQAFIDKVHALAAPKAKAEYQTLLARLQKEQPGAKEVKDWQKTYLEELVKQEEYSIDSQLIRQYFSYDKVRQGIFELTEQLFGVEIRPWETEVWHPSVTAYELWDKGRVIGRFYLDMHPRPGKYNHAAAFSVQDGVTGKQLPIYALVCNFPGGDGSEGLMLHSDVETFLHEFGHLLHGLFAGDQRWLAFAGIRTEWDFVEAPSQMLQDWVWDRETLAGFATNKNGEVIPAHLVEKMNAGRHFGRGIWTQHQLFYAALSLGLYNQDPAHIDLDRFTAEIQAKYSPFGYVDDTYFYTSFGHLNGYSAIYYTYMWSQVISADMFSEFEKGGLRNSHIADRYRRYVLAPGGSKDAAELVADFLGRPYSFDAFARDLNQ